MSAAADGRSLSIESEDLGWVAAAKAKSAEVRYAARDRVDERCWLSNPDTRTAAERVLIRRDIAVNGKDETAGPDLLVVIEVSGYEISEAHCSVSVRGDVLLHSASRHELGELALSSSSWRILWSDTALMTGPRDGMSERVKRAAVALLDAFLRERTDRIERIAAKVTEQGDEEALKAWHSDLSE